MDQSFIDGFAVDEGTVLGVQVADEELAVSRNLRVGGRDDEVRGRAPADAKREGRKVDATTWILGVPEAFKVGLRGVHA